MFLLQMQLMQCWLMRSKYNRRQTHLAETMVLTLHDNSEHVAHASRKNRPFREKNLIFVTGLDQIKFLNLSFDGMF